MSIRRVVHCLVLALAFGGAGINSNLRAGNECNCVAYARSQTTLPNTPLFTLQQKLAVVNNWNPNAPRVGAAAFFNYNHVAVVKKVWMVKLPNGRTEVYLTIVEANYIACKIGTRTGTPASLKIVGYYVKP